MSEQVRFALIGAGGIAQSYVSAFENNPSAKLVAVADVRTEAAQALAERAVCPAYTSVATLLESGPALDAVVLCTPPNTHEELVLAIIQRGLSVLCEKPFTLTSSSAKKLIAASQEAKVVLTMASKFRYVDDMIRLKSLMASGVLGEIVLIENAFTARVDMTSRWNSNPSISGGGVLIDNGTHSVDIMRYLMGAITDVHAIDFPRVQKLQVEDSVRLIVRNAKGLTGSIDLSWSINKELDTYLNVFGTHGTAMVGWKESKYRQHSARDWIKFGDGYNKVQAFRDELTNFARAVSSGEPLLIKAEDALASVEVIEAAYRSMNETGWTKV